MKEGILALTHEKGVIADADCGHCLCFYCLTNCEHPHCNLRCRSQIISQCSRFLGLGGLPELFGVDPTQVGKEGAKP